MESQKIGLNTILQGAQSKDEGLQYSVPPGWKQGRTIYGGLTSGLSLHAALKQFDDLPPLRSAQINFTGPVTGDPLFKARLLRRGRNVTSICVEGFVEEKLVSHIVFIFASSRNSSIAQDFPAPTASPPEDTPYFFTPQMQKMAPGFIQNFETRALEGNLPMSASETPDMRVWARMVDEGSREGMISLLTLGDLLPPAAAPLMTQFAPISSVNWTINFVREDISTRDGWWHVETKLTAAGNGYSSQIMRYWNTEGELVAEAIQFVTIFL